MKKDPSDEYELFYMELPQTSDLVDIEIQDEYDTNESASKQGLSEEQVADLARDSLGTSDSSSGGFDSKQSDADPA